MILALLTWSKTHRKNGANRLCSGALFASWPALKQAISSRSNPYHLACITFLLYSFCGVQTPRINLFDEVGAFLSVLASTSAARAVFLHATRTLWNDNTWWEWNAKVVLEFLPFLGCLVTRHLCIVVWTINFVAQYSSLEYSQIQQAIIFSSKQSTYVKLKRARCSDPWVFDHLSLPGQ